MFVHRTDGKDVIVFYIVEKDLMCTIGIVCTVFPSHPSNYHPLWKTLWISS